MVIDDYEDTASMFKISLQQNGWTVREFNDSLETLDYFKSYSGDIGILLTDIRMPRMSGIELASRCKEINPFIQIIFLTLYEKSEVEMNLKNIICRIQNYCKSPFV